MDLPAFRAASLAATTLLLIACSAARADEGAATTDLGTTATEQPAPAEAPATPVADGTATDPGTTDGGATSATPPEPATEATPAAEAVPAESVEPGSPSADTAPTSSPTSPGGPTPPLDPLAPETAPAEPPAAPPPDEPPLPPAAATKTAPAFTPLAQSDPETSGGLLTGVAHELRKVRRQIDDLRRRVDSGAPPPPTRIIRLRSRLERIAPALLALEARLEAAGHLSPRVQELLRRVRIHLSGARHSAARLIASLRHAGATGHELRLLLRELERLRVLGAALATTLSAELGPTPRSQPGTGTAYQPQAPATSSWHTATAPQEHRAGRPAAASRAGGTSGAPSPWSVAPGSASASAGGALFAAGFAGLAALLISLAPPLLRARLLPPPGRRRTVTFLTPLERPG